MADKTEEMDLITAVVRHSLAEHAVQGALKAGASGVTYCTAQGTGVRQKLGYAGSLIEGDKEIIWVVTKKGETAKVMDAIVQAANLSLPGEGFAYVQQVTRAVGFVTS